MKKTTLKKSQSTLFQTWGYFEKQKEISSASKPVEIEENLEDLADEFEQNFADDLNLLNNKEETQKEIFLDDKFKQGIQPENIPDFDNNAGATYIYPTNYPIRDYQFNIIRKALLQNTLVVLPTGLGKTFIAAVVMYNFYRWYPSGKLIFMAPTKPLVAQQVEACFKITGLPQVDTTEMTGAMPPGKREVLWKSKRVFFLTPQVLQNDLGRGSCSALDVVCLVFDEAHRALGNHAYCQVVKEIGSIQQNFRILALSATPGDDLKAVQQVINNLLISRIEIRSEDSIDIQKYVHERKVEKIVVPMSNELKQARNTFLEVMRMVVNRLFGNKALWQNDPERVSKYMLLKAREQWRANNAISDKTKSGFIEADFALCISLYHAYDLLQQHGILSFYTFLKGVLAGTKGTTRSKMELQRHASFMNMMEELHCKIEPNELNQSLNETIMAEKDMTPKSRLLKSIPKPLSSFCSHPKLKKLEDVVVDHFRKAQQGLESSNLSSQIPLNTRVMIFSQYRDSVQEITTVLSKYEPLVKVMSFIGQGSKEGASGKNTKGLSQKEQIEILQRFRSGGYNTVVSTSVGEEGLDIGDVDLIICFDASSSPIRLVQRMGRTGRKRNGRIVILVGEGKEEQTYKRSLSNKKGIHKNLINASKSLDLYAENSRMIPKHINPVCFKMSITVEEYQPRNKKKKNSEATKKKLKQNDGLLKKKKVETMSSNAADSNGIQGCSECAKLRNTKCCNHKNKKRSPKEKAVDQGRLFRKTFLKSLKGDDSDEDDFENNKENHIVDEDDLKPCSFETLLEKADDSLKKKKRKVTLTKLPAKSSKFDLDISDIQDNQLDFCSQVTMPTLFDRCQKRKSDQVSLKILEDDVNEDLAQAEDANIAKQTGGRLTSNKDSIPAGEKLNDKLKDQQQTNSSQDVLSFLPMSTPLNLENEKPRRKICVVTPIVRESVPEPPFDVDLSSFLLDTSIPDEAQEQHKLKDAIISGEVTSEKPETLVSNVDSESFFTDAVFTNVKNRTLSKCHQDFQLFDDSLMNLLGDDISELSPPMISQVDKTFNKVTNKEKNDAESEPSYINVNKENSFKSPVAESPLLRKKAMKNRKIIIDDSVEEECCNKKESEDSPLFRKPKSKSLKRNCIFESQKSPIETVENDQIEEEEDFDVVQKSKKRKTSSHEFTNEKKIRKKNVNMFLDDEAEDDCEDSHYEEEASYMDHYVMDSFIDDASQVTPVAPKRKRKTEGSVNMQLIYKQSLMSPKYNSLNFHTPAFKVGKSRYKMASLVTKYDRNKLDESSEAEEDNGAGESEEEEEEEEEEDADGVDYEEQLMINRKKIHNKNKMECNRRIGLDRRVSKTHKANRDETKNQEAHSSVLPEHNSKKTKRIMSIVDSDDECDTDQKDLVCGDPQQEAHEIFENFTSASDTIESRPWCKTFSKEDLEEITFSFGIQWQQLSLSSFDASVKNIDNGKKLAAEVNLRSLKSSKSVKDPAFVNDVEKLANVTEIKPEDFVVVMDSKCVANSQISSLLRTKEKCKVVIQSQLGCDFIVSKRTGVNKRFLSDIANGARSLKVTDSIRTLCSLFKNPVLIIEKDRVKGNATSKPTSLTKYYAGVLAKLACTNVRTLHSNSQEETASLLSHLAKMEANLGFSVHQPSSPQLEQMVKNLLRIPKVTYPVAMEIIKYHTNIRSLIDRSLEDLKSMLSFIPAQDVNELFFFFKRSFDITMYGSKNLL